MTLFLNKHVALFLLVVTTALDASRIFYFPLAKIHPSEPAVANVEEVAIKKPVEGEVSSAADEPKIEKRQRIFDWEALIDDEAARQGFPTDELLPKSLKHFDEENFVHRPIQIKVSEKQGFINKPSPVDEAPAAEEPWSVDSASARVARLQSNPEVNAMDRKKRRNDVLFLVVVGTCCAVGLVGLLAAAVFWYKIQKRAQSAADAEYPSYGVTGPTSSGGKISPSSTMSDRKLAQSAQMFHYQQQRQQMMAQEKAHLDAKPVHSDDSDDETPAGGDYTVYECPGLAPTGEMEVRNPLFTEPESSLTVSPTNSQAAINGLYPQLSTASPTKEKSLP